MDIKNYGFFIVDIQNKKIYVDLYLYYIVYSSNEKSTELHNNELKRDFESLLKNITDIEKYICFIDLRRDAEINSNTKSNTTRNITIYSLFNFLNERLKKIKIKKFYVLGEQISDKSVFMDEVSDNDKYLNHEYTYENKQNIYNERGIEIEEIKTLLNIEFADGEVDLVHYFLNDCLKKLTVVRKPDNQFIYLESANVFASEYIFIKRLFIYPEIKLYFVYCLLMGILKFARTRSLAGDEITLVSASDTGAMLVTEICLMANSLKDISSVPKIKSQHILHLGPKTNFEKHGFNLEQLLGNYIYVYDFMCEGNEFRNLKNLFAIKDAEFLGAFGVAIYDYPRGNCGDYEKEGICALVDVKKWSENDKLYEIRYNK